MSTLPKPDRVRAHLDTLPRSQCGAALDRLQTRAPVSRATLFRWLAGQRVLPASDYVLRLAAAEEGLAA